MHLLEINGVTANPEPLPLTHPQEYFREGAAFGVGNVDITILSTAVSANMPANWYRPDTDPLQTI